MFGQLLFVRIRAAEKALRDGRLDEAFRLAMTPDLRENKRGQAVLAALSEKFLERAREHYQADRFGEALLDLDRADAGGILKDEIVELRKYVQTVAAEHHRSDESRRRRVDDAVRRIEDGSLAAGRRMLEQASAGDALAARVRRTAEKRAADMGEIVAQAERLMAAGQLAAAAERVRRAKSIDAHSAEAARLEVDLCNRVLASARSALAEGRPARASDELACLGELGKALPAKRELLDVLALAREAGAHVRAGRYGDARRCAMSLARQLSNAKWLGEAIEQLRQMEDLHAALAAGPLLETRDWELETREGARAEVCAVDKPRRYGPVAYAPGSDGNPPVSPLGKGGGGRIGVRDSENSASLDDTVAIPGRLLTEDSIPERLLLLVDGGGSFLVLRGGAATVGRAAADHPADVPIFSDVAERHVNITRVDDDYFVFGTREIEVGGVRTRHTLLRDGDRVVLGKKAKFTFRVPSRRSATAVLELSDTTKMPNDVRRVVLLQHAATIGCGPTAHIPCRQAGVPLVLFERNGGLWVRRQGDGHVDTEAKSLRLGEPMEIGGVSLVLQRWTSAAKA